MRFQRAIENVRHTSELFRLTPLSHNGPTTVRAD